MSISGTISEKSEKQETVAVTPKHGMVETQAKLRPEQTIFMLGLWFSGLESYLNLFGSTVHKRNYITHDWSHEFSLTHSVLLVCSKHTFDLIDIVSKKERPAEDSKNDEANLLGSLESASSAVEFDTEELFELSSTLRELILISDGLLRAKPLGFKDWAAWNSALSDKIKGIEVVQELIRVAESEASDFLPREITSLIKNNQIPVALEADLNMVLPYFGRILKWLDVVGTMLREDRPIKSTLLIFARIHDQMKEMMDYLNNRLSRYPNEDDELFGSLDSAAYTTSIELRKVYDQELRELISVRAVPMVVAKIENSYYLLNDSLQLTLVNFAKLIDQNVEGSDLFPGFREKEQQSIKLRQDLWNVLQEVQKAEHDSENYPMESLRILLNDFVESSLGYIFYKDIETVERFIEEIMLTKDKKDIVPILHRFGAYAETLLGQINMRAVLAKHPFAPLQVDSLNMFG
ncbi:MAG: hypothetical protein ACK5NT_02190 [Pyrinomonadaceae bacterium]